MAAHDSQYPGEAKGKSFRFDQTGISMNWRNVIIGTITLLGTLGGYTGIRFVTCDQMEEAIGKAKAEQSSALQGVKSTVEAQGEQLVGLTATVGQVQDTQHMDIAVREARRVVEESIKCRRNDADCQEKRVREIERVRRINMKRLAVPRNRSGPLEPCANLQCQ